MKFPKILLIPILLLILLVGCGPRPETGEIGFKVPTVSDKGFATFHDPAEVGQLSISVSLYSSFEMDKEARIYVDNTGPYSCWLSAGITSPCNNVPLSQPGVHTLRAEVDKMNGEVVSTEISVEWVPYSPIESFALNLAGRMGIQSPQLGFNVIVFIFASLLVVLFLALKSSKEGAVVFSVLVLLGIVFFAPPDISALIVEGLYGVAVVFIFIFLIKAFFDRMRHLTFMHVPGKFTGAYAGAGGEEGASVVRELGNAGQRTISASEDQTYLPGYDESEYLPGDVITPLRLPPGRRRR